MRFRSFLSLVTIIFVFGTVCGFAQAFEINPYGGVYWPGTNNQVGDFAWNQLIGVRGGYSLTPAVQLGFNYSWSNHFQPSDKNTAASFAGNNGFTQGSVRANIWDAEFTYNFGKRGFLGSSVTPYASLGAGGLTANIKQADQFVLNTRSVVTPSGTALVANDVLQDHDTFFQFSYGGGVKALRLWGPMGVFGDFRGRTIPNFFAGHGTNWPELTAGLTFSWGER